MAERLPEFTRIADYVFHYAETRPDDIALIFDTAPTTYRELAEEVETYAKALISAGVQHGDRVAVLSTPRPEFLFVFLAAARIGAAWLGINPRYTADEIAYVLGDARPKIIFSIETNSGRNYPDDIHLALRRLDLSCEVVPFGGAGVGRLSDFLCQGELVSGQVLKERSEGVKGSDPVLIVYTSGTTGKPKGALLPQFGLAYCTRFQHRYWGALKGCTSIINPFPINHLASVGDISCLALASGGTIVLMERFDPGEYLRNVERFRISVIGLIPTMYLMLMEDAAWNKTNFSSVQRMVWGGAAAPKDLIRKLQRITPHLSGAYGSTETVGQVCFTQDGASFEQLAETIGPPVPEYEVRIADSFGREVPRGIEGEIQVRGDFVLIGYLNNPEATRDAFTTDGWLKTGDAALQREDDCYKIVGRLKEMFKSGGYNVYPREIEICLEAHPDIDMAAVISVPDPLYNEVGEAFCIIATGVDLSEADVQEFCRERLANYKIPKRVHLRSSLPMLPVGKVDKQALRAELGA
jgi:acyl-CoA synthetase (AMP-forming)/AMP-acid ligase II